MGGACSCADTNKNPISFFYSPDRLAATEDLHREDRGLKKVAYTISSQKSQDRARQALVSNRSPNIESGSPNLSISIPPFCEEKKQTTSRGLCACKKEITASGGDDDSVAKKMIREILEPFVNKKVRELVNNSVNELFENVATSPNGIQNVIQAQYSSQIAERSQKDDSSAEQNSSNRVVKISGKFLQPKGHKVNSSWKSTSIEYLTDGAFADSFSESSNAIGSVDRQKQFNIGPQPGLDTEAHGIVASISSIRLDELPSPEDAENTTGCHGRNIKSPLPDDQQPYFGIGPEKVESEQMKETMFSSKKSLKFGTANCVSSQQQNLVNKLQRAKRKKLEPVVTLHPEAKFKNYEIAD